MIKKEFLPIQAEVEQSGKVVLDAAFRVHSILGPGLLESVYEVALGYELIEAGCKVQNQIALPVLYREIEIPSGLRLDMIVNDHVIVELKAVDTLLPLHKAQLLTYLRMTGIRLGYLINFNVQRLKTGIQRIVY